MTNKTINKLRALVFDHINNYMDEAKFPKDNAILIHCAELKGFVYLNLNTGKFKSGHLADMIKLLSTEALLSFMEKRFQLVATA